MNGPDPNDAAGRVAAYLDAWSQHPHPTTRDCEVAAFYDHVLQGALCLTEPDLREVLRQFDGAKTEAFEQRNLAANGYHDTVKALQGWDQALLERDQARAEVERLTRERDEAHGDPR